jgi:hypothetical protein
VPRSVEGWIFEGATLIGAGDDTPGAAELTSGSAAYREQLLQLLRCSPFHWWASLRTVMRDSDRDTFDDVAATVRAEWSSDEVSEHLRKALIAVSTEAVQTLPLWSASVVESAHLDNAAHALAAARTLAAQLSSEPDLLPATSTSATDSAA